jgi:hypothetical protein
VLCIVTVVFIIVINIRKFDGNVNKGPEDPMHRVLWDVGHDLRGKGFRRAAIHTQTQFRLTARNISDSAGYSESWATLFPTRVGF